MIRPQDMTMARIITPVKRIRTVVESLYDLKLLHIMDFKKTEESFFDIGKPLKNADIYSQQLVDIRAMIARLGVSGTPTPIKNLRGAQKNFLKLNAVFKNLVKRLDKLKSEKKDLVEEANNPLINLTFTEGSLKEYRFLTLFKGTVKSPLEPKIKSITNDYLLSKLELEKQTAFVLFVKKGFEEKVKSLLNELGFKECRFPKLAKKEIEGRLAEIRKEITASENHLDDLRQKNSRFLLNYELALTQITEKLEVPLRFAESKTTFVVTGWIPTNKAEQLKSDLNKITNEKIHIEFIPGENPPIQLKNPQPVKNFEFFLDLYSLPKIYEIDPTVLMFITFPLFFGFMLGDVGYGIITLGITVLLGRLLSPAVKPLLRIVMISSLATISFGFIFGEFFGHGFIQHPILDRVHDMQTMMLVSIAVGLIHINFGLVLGILNEMKHHSFLMSFFRKGSWMILQAGIGILWLGYSQSNFAFSIAGGALGLVSLLMMIKGEGFLRIVEIPSILSNILSYIRLYAIGLASVSLAVVVNDLAFKFFSNGGISIVFGILMLLIGHAINLLLGLLGPFLHSVRLHYVEFFQKFYEGGGQRYNPFGISKRIGG